MRDIIICTVGISVVENLRGLGWSLSNTIQVAKRLHDEIDPTDKRCGAEINSTRSIIQKRIIETARSLHLCISDTADGDKAGDILKQYFNRQFDAIEKHRIEGLNDRDFKEFKNTGLRNLARKIAGLVRAERQRGSEPIINATGGFKAQMAFAALLGQVLCVPVYYQFEDFPEIIELPPLPVRFDYGLCLEPDNFQILYKLQRENTLSVDEINLNRLSPRLAVLIEREEDCCALSTLGELILDEAVRYSIERAAIYLSSRSVKTYEKLDSTQRERIDNHLAKLRDPELRTQNLHSRFEGREIDCACYKQPNTTERIFYYVAGQADVFVCEIFTDHESYERFIEKNSILPACYSNFSKHNL